MSDVHGVAGRTVVRPHDHRAARDSHHGITDITLYVDTAVTPATTARGTELTSTLSRLVGFIDVAIAWCRPSQAALALQRPLPWTAALLFGQCELLRDRLPCVNIRFAGGLQLIRRLKRAHRFLGLATVNAGPRLQSRPLTIAESQLVQRSLKGTDLFTAFTALQYTISQR